MRASEEIEASEQDAEPAENLGTRLRRAREAQEISLDVISAELRIAVPALVALEECRFEALGPAVFAKGYLKQYGTRLGLDVAELVAEYERIAGGGAIEIAPSRSIRIRDERQITIWIAAIIVLALIATILAVWWWLGRDFGPSDTTALAVTGSAAPATDVAPRAAEPVSGGPRDLPAVDTASSPVAPASRGGDTESALADAAPTPTDTLAPDVAGADTGPAESSAPPSAEPVAAAITGPALEIVFLEDSWTDITDATGERLYYGLGRAGTRATIPADRRLNVFFGYADGVSLSIDGEPFPIPASARRRDDLAQFDLEAQVSRNP